MASGRVGARALCRLVWQLRVVVVSRAIFAEETRLVVDVVGRRARLAARCGWRVAFSRVRRLGTNMTQGAELSSGETH